MPNMRSVKGSRRSPASASSQQQPYRHRHRSGPVPVGQTICRLARPNAATASGGTQLGGISKQGDRYLRRLLVVGATAVIRHTKDKPTPMANWIRKLLVKKPFRVVSVALANKLTRIAWVALTRKEAYRPYQLAA